MQTRSHTRKIISTNPQEHCPLFTKLPGEIRDRIFQHAVTEYTPRRNEYAKTAHYYRPHYRYADNYIDTALLRTCRRIHAETVHLPEINYEHVEWRYRAPPTHHRRANLSCIDERFPTTEMLSMHIFAQQYWLEGWSLDIERMSKKAPALQYLKLTLRHGDWWNWEAGAPLKLDPKQQGTASLFRLSKAEEGFHQLSWGNHIRSFGKLREFELELETIEEKRGELDEIVQKAAGWRFPAAEGRVLVLNPKRTRRTGWVGMIVPGYTTSRNRDRVSEDPMETKRRLEQDGVDFTITDGEPEIVGDATQCQVYYVVTMAFEAQRAPEVRE